MVRLRLFDSRKRKNRANSASSPCWDDAESLGLLSRFCRGRGRLRIVEHRVAVIGSAHIHHGERERRAHKDHSGPCGEAGEHVGCGAGTEGCLRALAAESACEIGGTALLEEHHSNQKKADDDVHDDDEVEENLHCFSCFPGLIRWTESANSLVRRRGLEPLCLAALAPQASASANFATSA